MRQNFLKLGLIIVLIFFSSALCHAQDEDTEVTEEAVAEPTPTIPAVKKKKITPDTYYYAGEKYYNARKYGVAIRYYYAATKLDKNYQAAWKKLAFCYYKLNKHKYAYPAFQKVLEFNPEDQDAKTFMTFYTNLMEKQKRKKEKREVIDSVWRAAALPGWGQFYNNQTLKGTIIGGGFIVSTGLTIYSVLDERLKYDKYTKTNENHEIALKEAQSAWTTALIWTIVTAAVYAGGIIDAALNYDCVEARLAGAGQGPAVMLCTRW